MPILWEKIFFFVGWKKVERKKNKEKIKKSIGSLKSITTNTLSGKENENDENTLGKKRKVNSEISKHFNGCINHLIVFKNVMHQKFSAYLKQRILSQNNV